MGIIKQALGACLFLAGTVSAFAAGDGNCRVVAHRGHWTAEGAAQNSIAALQKAAEIGCDAVELDVWLTADSVLVVNHDTVFKGVRIQDAPSDSVLAIVLANGEHLPTLEAFLTEAENFPQMGLVLELKPHTDLNREDYAAARIVEMLDNHGLADRTEIISFSINGCLAFRKLRPEMPVYYLNGDLAPISLKRLGMAPDYSMRTFRNHPEWIADAQERGLKVNVWTINTEEEMREFLDQNVDIITTNHPELLLPLLGR